MGVIDRVDALADLRERLLPGDANEFAVHLLERVVETIRIVQILCGGAPLAAHIAVAARAGFVGPDIDDLAVFDLHFEPAAQDTHIALGFLPF